MPVEVFASPERDAAIERLLEAGLGAGTWRPEALRTHVDPDADLLFPGGASEMVEAWIDLADRRMIEAAEAEGIALEPGTANRVRHVLLLRLGQAAPHREAMRRALAIQALPANAGAGARSLARTVDAIWRAAGDTSGDASWYTKRLTLGAVYGATLLWWLAAEREAWETSDFVDRRLAGVARLGRLRARLAPRRPDPA